MKNKQPHQWNLSHFFDSLEDPRIQIELDESGKMVDDFVSKWRDRTDYLEQPEILYQALIEYEKLAGEVGLVGAVQEYLWLRLQIDQNNPELMSKKAIVDQIHKKRLNDIQFFELNVAKIPKDLHETFLHSEKLKDFKHYIETIFDEARYKLSEGEERIINLFSKGAHKNWVSMLSTKLTLEERELTIGNSKKTYTLEGMLRGMLEQDQQTRDSIATDFNNVLRDHSFIAEREFNSFLEYRKVVDELRGFQRPDKVAFLRDDVDEDVVDVFLQSVVDNYDISREYYALKAKALGKDVLQYHERTLSMGKASKEYPWEKTTELVLDIMSGIDQEFADIVSRMLEDGCVDVYPRVGKAGGAYCTYGARNMKQYILLNDNAKIYSVISFAHECGHAIHHDYFNNHQHSLNARGSKFTAEVSSKFMEGFAYDAVFAEIEKDDEAVKSMLFAKLDNAVSSIFRQVAGFKFEQEIHALYRKEGFLSHQRIGEVFSNHMSAYMGGSVSQDPGSENWWIYWGHLRKPFYVYSYATGELIAYALYAKYKQNNRFIEKIKDYFKDGLARPPKEQFALMGVDITNPQFWVDGIEQIRKDLETLKALV